MIVKLSRSLRIEATDGLNYTLQRLRVREEGARAGSSYWSTIGYYPSLELAARAALRKELATGDAAASASRLVEVAREMGARIARACEQAVDAAEAARCLAVVGDEFSVGDEFPEEESAE